MRWRYGKSIPHGGICPVFFCSHSLMDRISDSGSDGLGSNPDGSTTTVIIFSPDEMNRQGFAEDLACFYFMEFYEFGHGPGNHRFVRIKTFSQGQTSHFEQLIRKYLLFHGQISMLCLTTHTSTTKQNSFHGQCQCQPVKTAIPRTKMPYADTTQP